VAADRAERAGRQWLFTYGILRDPALLERLLGAVPPGGGPAEVRGYARHTSRQGYYYLVPADDAPPVPGVLWRVTPAELAVLDEVEDVDPADPGSPHGEYRRVRGQAHTASGAVACWLYEGARIADVGTAAC
jgi:gamma-glutamylcyclotransferase (GGCT)/AIG2-like uncharacterized protein YtfP